MAVDKKFFVDINLQGNALNNATIGTNSDMTKGGSFRFDGIRLEYFDGSSTQSVANLADISAVTGGLILQGGYNAATETPNITGGSALKGFFWVVTESGSFLGTSVQVGDSIIAKVDAAGASIGDWLILQGNIVTATDEVEGIVRLATQEEVDAGTEGGAVVLTPATFENSSQIQGIRNEIKDLGDNKISRDGSIAMTGNLDMDGNSITNLSDPTNSNDAARKKYVDDAATTAQRNAEDTASADATTKADAAQAAAESYADGLAVNYDAAGSAATAETNAKAYADSLAPNYDAAGSAATAQANAEAFATNAADTAQGNAGAYTDSAIAKEVTDRNSAIATAKGEAIADSNSYTDGAIAQEVTDRDAAIATAKSEAIADANSYTDSGLALKLDLTGGAMTGPISMGGVNQITDLAEPQYDHAAATKYYVDSVVSGTVNAAFFEQSFVDTAWTLSDGVYTLSVEHFTISTAPKVSCYVSGNLVEFSVVVINNYTIELKSNIAPPASVLVGVSK